MVIGGGVAAAVGGGLMAIGTLSFFVRGLQSLGYCAAEDGCERPSQFEDAVPLWATGGPLLVGGAVVAIVGAVRKKKATESAQTVRWRVTPTPRSGTLTVRF